MKAGGGVGGEWELAGKGYEEGKVWRNAWELGCGKGVKLLRKNSLSVTYNLVCVVIYFSRVAMTRKTWRGIR